jgi:hypothetical protein
MKKKSFDESSEIFDLFAGLAMHAILQRSNLSITRDSAAAERLAKWAYGQAAAMMAVREGIDFSDIDEDEL